MNVISETTLCPMQVWKIYISKLSNKIDNLWQKPRSGKIFYDDPEWFEGRVVGKDPLERFMKFLSADLELSISYTNHSIQSTVIMTLDQNGFEARHIMKLSSHKNEATIKEYAVKCPDTKKREMCESLSNAIKPKKQKPTCTVSVNQETTTDVANSLPTFSLELMENFNTIDDAELLKILYETEQKEQEKNKQGDKDVKALQVAKNSTPNNVMPVPMQITNPLQQQNQNTVNTLNTSVTNKYPMLPLMYFPNSSVTINYNFGKQ